MIEMGELNRAFKAAIAGFDFSLRKPFLLLG